MTPKKTYLFKVGEKVVAFDERQILTSNDIELLRNGFSQAEQRGRDEAVDYIEKETTPTGYTREPAGSENKNRHFKVYESVFQEARNPKT